MQYIDVGHNRNGAGADTEVDQEWRTHCRMLPRQYCAHRWNKFGIELLAERISADQPVTFDPDIHDGGPGMIGELLERTIDV